LLALLRLDRHGRRPVNGYKVCRYCARPERGERVLHEESLERERQRAQHTFFPQPIGASKPINCIVISLVDCAGVPVQVIHREVPARLFQVWRSNERPCTRSLVVSHGDRGAREQAMLEKFESYERQVHMTGPSSAPPCHVDLFRRAADLCSRCRRRCRTRAPTDSARGLSP